jgi:hypothetical protein
MGAYFFDRSIPPEYVVLDGRRKRKKIKEKGDRDMKLALERLLDCFQANLFSSAGLSNFIQNQCRRDLSRVES